MYVPCISRRTWILVYSPRLILPRFDQQGQCKIWIARDGKRVTSEVDIAPDDTAEIAREKLQQSLATN